MPTDLVQIVVYFPSSELKAVERAASKQGHSQRSNWIREACKEKLKKEAIK